MFGADREGLVVMVCQKKAVYLETNLGGDAKEWGIGLSSRRRHFDTVDTATRGDRMRNGTSEVV